MNIRWNRLIAVLEMGGGIIGVLASIMYLEGSNFQLLGLLVAALFIGLYVLSIVAGWYLWKNAPRGLSLSMLVQALQIPQIMVPGLTYFFVSGLAISISVSLDYETFKNIGFNPNIQFPSTWFFELGKIGEQLVLGMNILSLVCFSYLQRQSKSKSSSEPLAIESDQEMVEAHQSENGSNSEA